MIKRDRELGLDDHWVWSAIAVVFLVAIAATTWIVLSL